MPLPDNLDSNADRELGNALTIFFAALPCNTNRTVTQAYSVRSLISPNTLTFS